MENNGTHIKNSTVIEKPMKIIKDKHTYMNHWNINENDETRVTTIEKSMKTMKDIKTIEQSMRHD